MTDRGAMGARHALVPAVFLGLFLVFLGLFDRIIVQQVSVTDFAAHLEMLEGMRAGTVSLPHPLFHILTFLASRLGGATWEGAAVVLMAAVLTSTALVQYWIVRALLGGGVAASERALVAALLLTLVCAIYVPNVNPHIYLGQLSPNVYHNPTYPLMKLLALPALYQAMRILDGERQVWRLWVCALATGMSAIAKPSFAPVFLAGMGVVVAAEVLRQRRSGIDRRLVGFYAALAVLTAVVLGVQYLVTFTSRSVDGASFDPSGHNQLVVDEFLRHWRTRTPSVVFSIVAALAFPLSVLVLRTRRVLARPSGWLAWAVLGFGMAAYAWLIDRTTPGVSNLGWSYMIGQAAVFLTATVEFMYWSAERPRAFGYRFAASLLALHAISGVYYFLQVASGGGFS